MHPTITCFYILVLKGCRFVAVRQERKQLGNRKLDGIDYSDFSFTQSLDFLIFHSPALHDNFIFAHPSTIATTVDVGLRFPLNTATSIVSIDINVITAAPADRRSAFIQFIAKFAVGASGDHDYHCHFLLHVLCILPLS